MIHFMGFNFGIREVFMKKNDLAQTFVRLKNNFLFCGCDSALFDEHINEGTCDVVHYTASEPIYEPKHYKKSIGVVLSGKIYVHSSDDSRQVLLRTIEEGELFGVAALFAEDVDFATNISAKTECDILFIGDETIYALIEKDGCVRKNYITFLSEKIRFLNRKITYFTAGSTERKLALYLSSLKRNGSSVRLSLPMSALADMLDVGRASLYRAFEKLSEDGFIERDKKEIKLLAPQKMREYYN